MPYIYKMSNAGGMSTVTRYTDMLAGNDTFVPSSYESISTVTVGSGGASTVTFSSIPATYTHLVIRSMVSASAATTDIKMNFNGDTAANYSQHSLYGTGTSAGVAASASSSYALAGITSATSANVAANITDVLDYANTSKNKTIRTLAGSDNNGSGGYIFFESSAWYNTTAITSIVLTPFTGTFSQYSSFALYGIKG